ncbi:MAG: glycosyltransferase family 39 protein [Egibacteraceae bacterium]
MSSAPLVDASCRRRAAVLLCIGSACVYLAAAHWVNLGSGAVFGDAFSRVAIANQVVASRDPSLADIGFVWSPLPILALLPLVVLADWWPALLRDGFAANIVAALCMAGAVVVVWLTVRDAGAKRWAQVFFTASFALHPMVLAYGANGMSEAMFLLFCLLGMRALARWLQHHETRDLIGAGVHVGVAYFARYEAVTSAAAVGALVAAVTLCRTSGSLRDRIPHVLGDGLTVAFPPLVAFVGWAAASWLIVGQPFEQFSSAYGNSAQVGIGVGIADPGRVARQLALLTPALPVVLLAAWHRRDTRSLAPLIVCGGPLAFYTATMSAGASFGWLRFLILAVPLTVLLASYCAAPASALQGSPCRWCASEAFRGVVAVVVVAASIGSTCVVFTDPLLASDESALVEMLTGHPRPDNPHAKQRFQSARDAAVFLDDLNLPKGSVLLDSWEGYAIVTMSDNPSQFVLNVDRDFFAAHARPHALVDYLLVPGGSATARLDAVNRNYPELYDGGEPSTTLIREFAGRRITWRLYRLDHATVAGS